MLTTYLLHINQAEHPLRAGKSTVYALKQITIDLDTVKTCLGHQEVAKKGYNHHKRSALLYHPLLAFCAETKEVPQGWLCSGDAYTANGSVKFMKQLLVTLPSHMKIFFRADSGLFCRTITQLSGKSWAPLSCQG